MFGVFVLLNIFFWFHNPQTDRFESGEAAWPVCIMLIYVSIDNIRLTLKASKLLEKENYDLFNRHAWSLKNLIFRQRIIRIFCFSKKELKTLSEPIRYRIIRARTNIIVLMIMGLIFLLGMFAWYTI